MAEHRFLRACRRQPVDRTPVWFMRQAGRYMAEYRRLREKYSILEVVKTPELAAEVTLQPIRAFDLDAAIVFADILPPLEAMGLDLEFAKGKGPVIHNPIRRVTDVEALRVPPAEEAVGFTLEAIRLVRRDLNGAVPLIGFSGAPFTLASYAIEGGSSRNYTYAKTLMYDEPAAWHLLMDKLTQLIGDYLQAQVEAGAQALQVFDSWVGALGPSDFTDHVLPYSREVVRAGQATGVPIIYFGTNTSGMLELIRDTGADVIGLDWRIHLDEAWSRLGHDVSVQGNLDPAALLGNWSWVERRAADILERVGDRPGHIFNLGHGILPQTPVENVAALADYVHGWGNRQN